MKVYTLKTSFSEYIDFEYNWNINALPTITISLPIRQDMDTLIDGFATQKCIELWFYIEDEQGDIIYSFPKTTWDIVNQKVEREILTLNLVYGNVLTFHRNAISNTLFNQSLAGLWTFFLTSNSEITNKFNLDTITNTTTWFYRFESDMSPIEFLNYLNNYGYFWYVEPTHPKPTIRLRSYLEAITGTNILDYEDYEVEKETLLFNTIRLVKEPYDTNIPTSFIITTEEKCITLPFPVDPNFILQSGLTNDVWIMGLNEQANEMRVMFNHFPVGPSVAWQTYAPCMSDWEWTYSTNCNTSGCLGRPCQGTPNWCNKYNSSTNELVCCPAPWGGCVKHLVLFPAYGSNYIPPDTKITINITNINGICDTEIRNTYPSLDDLNFDKQLITHTININNTTCYNNTTANEVRFANISPALWNIIKNFYANYFSKPKLKVNIKNPVFYFNIYHRLYGKRYINSLLLQSHTIRTTEKGWSSEASYVLV